MIIKSIQNVFNVWSNYTQQLTYKTVVDNKTLREYTTITIHDFYDKKGQIQQEERYGKLDVKA
jgi:hypothetical protein